MVFKMLSLLIDRNFSDQWNFWSMNVFVWWIIKGLIDEILLKRIYSKKIDEKIINMNKKKKFQLAIQWNENNYMAADVLGFFFLFWLTGRYSFIFFLCGIQFLVYYSLRFFFIDLE